MTSLRSDNRSTSSGSLRRAQRLQEHERLHRQQRQDALAVPRRRRNRSRIHHQAEATSSSSTGSAGGTAAINAAALQQHFMRSVSLAVPNFALGGSRNIVKSNARNAGRGGGQRRRRLSSSSSASSSSSSSGTSATTNDNTSNMNTSNHQHPRRSNRNNASATAAAIQRELHYATRPWTCLRCTHLNRARHAMCPACGQQRDESVSAAAGDGAVGLAAQVEHSGPLMDQDRSAQATLAQQRGLVPALPAPLTDAEWQEAEWNHEFRDAQRGMVETDCAICMERLGSGDQVILSCSHVYHAVCLGNFEKFTRRIDRSCPLCRQANYQKKAYSPAQALLRKRSAVKIQSRFRRYWRQKTYNRMLQQHYSAGKGDRGRAHNFFADRVTAVSDRLVDAVNHKANAVDALMDEGNRALALSRSIFAGMGEVAVPEESSRSSRIDGREVVEDRHRLSSTPSAGVVVADSVWREARRKAEERGLSDCPICMASLSRAGLNLPERPNCAKDGKARGASSSPTVTAHSPNHRRHVSLLSCTHVFHEACIEAFERFARNDDGSGSGSSAALIFTCPVCRSGYNRRRLGSVVLLPEPPEALG